MSYRARVRGCLLGGAIGDALGNPVEFLSIHRIRERFGQEGLTDLVGDPALITDDTQMTLFTAEGLIRASVRWDRGVCHPPSVVHRAYLRWLDTQRLPGPPADVDGWLAGHEFLYARRAPGNACLSGLSTGRMGTPDNPANPDSKGCGAVMRSAPFGLHPGWSAAQAFDLAVECAVQTHGHPSGYLAAGAFAAIVHALAVEERGLVEAVEGALTLLRQRPRHDEVTGALERALTLDRAVTPERVELLGGGWVAEEALAIAVYAAVAFPGDVRRALLAAANHAGDSDSTAAIAGNLLGAWHGEDALPTDWALRVEGRDPILEVADDLALEFTNGRRPWSPARYPGA
ncbi:ADP-ribosylglycohydrolase family protein [Asanoa sp. WMMD1127]|uniref:ADP-ribosylglycohydrolase family protein n=1 Tax=Asanoa sp. WMMD1127 TaxID=3016107 RepID=UPI00241703EE|nr:ADP-ribosylglycohydrolase family protein [Asanoa sp. WMMD1127]MDG4820699.1 ADP-ribosylglycohydrolase family protein [Asanoa sp. WMMD1127]